MLFVLSTSCKNPDNEHLKLRQIMREEDGSVCKRVYNIPGEPEKEFVEIYFRNGVLKEQYYRSNGQLNGCRTTYYTNGQLSETGNWRNDQRVGLFMYYRMDGQLDCTRHFSLLGESISK